MKPALEAEAAGLSARLPPLLLAARRIAATLSPGRHGRRRAGPGEDFWQFRPHGEGDSASGIDWRKSAKGEKLFVREREWAAANTLWLWSQSGEGMDWRSKLSSVSKRQRANLLLMVLAMLAADAHEQTGILGSGLAPGHSPATLARMAQWLEQAPAQLPLPPLAELPRHSTLILAGDFLAPLNEIRDRFRALAGRVASAHVIEIADPAEESLPWQGRVEFQSMDGADRLTLGRAEALRADYVTLRARHRAGLKDMIAGLGWSHILHRTDEAPASLLLTLHRHLSARPE